MYNLIIEFFKSQNQIIIFLNDEKKLNSNIYYFKYLNYKSINKLNLIIKSLKSLLNKNIIASFENLILKLEIESNNNSILYFENYFQSIPKNQNCIFLGVNNENTPIYEKIENIKSLLIGGSSGSGKSNLIHQIILSGLLNNKELYFLMIDLKATELTRYNIFVKNKRLIKPVANDFKTALKTIIYFYIIIKKRFKKMIRTGQQQSNESPIILIIDEYAQLFNNSKEKKIINNYISKIGAIGRASNCYLILATQHPTNENINNTIRSNLQSRICLKVQSIQQSNNILNNTLAIELNQPGQSIIHIDGKSPQRLQSSFISNNFLNRFIKINS